MQGVPTGATRAREILDEETTTANSAIQLTEDRRTIVQLDPDHPGFRDPEYRERRNAIAQIAHDFEPGTPVPNAPYVKEEHAVWRVIREALGPAQSRHACEEYLRVSDELDLSLDRIPQLGDVSSRLQAKTGFRLEPVGGLVHPKVFLSTLGDGIFLSTQYIRHHSTPLYTPEPDVVHELLGHACTLASPLFCELNRLVGLAAARATNHEGLERLGRVYWFSIEFGVLREAGVLKAYGAGLLSSAGELEAMHDAELRPFDPELMERQEYDVTQYQPVLFAADSMGEMVDVLTGYLTGWRD